MSVCVCVSHLYDFSWNDAIKIKTALGSTNLFIKNTMGQRRAVGLSGDQKGYLDFYKST